MRKSAWKMRDSQDIEGNMDICKQCITQRTSLCKWLTEHSLIKIKKIIKIYKGRHIEEADADVNVSAFSQKTQLGCDRKEKKQG